MDLYVVISAHVDAAIAGVARHSSIIVIFINDARIRLEMMHIQQAGAAGPGRGNVAGRLRRGKARIAGASANVDHGQFVLERIQSVSGRANVAQRQLVCDAQRRLRITWLDSSVVVVVVVVAAVGAGDGCMEIGVGRLFSRSIWPRTSTRHDL